MSFKVHKSSVPKAGSQISLIFTLSAWRARLLSANERAYLDSTLLAKRQHSPLYSSVSLPAAATWKTVVNAHVGQTRQTREACCCVLVLYDASHKLHRDQKYHPEQPARLDACLDVLVGLPSDRVRLQDVSEASTFAFSRYELDNARAMLVEAHTERFVANFETACGRAQRARLAEGESAFGFLGNIDPTTYVTSATYDVCLRATAAWIRATDLAMEQSDSNAAMALTRPPGHHATKSVANGFCIFNFAAAAAIHALHKFPNIKISILDWDVHYGQGVADIVQRHHRVRYVSIHQIDAFPYEEGQKQAKRFGNFSNIMTIPIQAGTTWGGGYEQVFTERALPFICTDGEWEPDLVIVCSGYDALHSDELAGMSLRAPDYRSMTRLLREHVSRNRKKQPGLMLGLEGGYQLSKGCTGGNLPDALLETVKALYE